MTTTTAVEVLTRADLLTAAPTNDVVALQRDYLELCARLLDDGDYQAIGGKRYKTKSAWRKLAAAFNASDTLDERTYDYQDDGTIRRAEYVVTATAPNGRSAVGVGIASIHERKFTNPEHDIPATAHTRAKNRAFSDLFGLGEVSAEEMRNVTDDQDRPSVTWGSGAAARRSDEARASLPASTSTGTPDGVAVGGPVQPSKRGREAGLYGVA